MHSHLLVHLCTRSVLFLLSILRRHLKANDIWWNRREKSTNPFRRNELYRRQTNEDKPVMVIVLLGTNTTEMNTKKDLHKLIGVVNDVLNVRLNTTERNTRARSHSWESSTRCTLRTMDFSSDHWNNVAKVFRSLSKTFAVQEGLSFTYWWCAIFIKVSVDDEKCRKSKLVDEEFPSPFRLWYLIC